MATGTITPEKTLSENKRLTIHAINNRLNTLMMGMSLLENSATPDSQAVLNSLKLELRDLHHLIEQLKYSD